MGIAPSKYKLDIGDTPLGAAKILARLSLKLRDALAARSWDRAALKAKNLLRLAFAWDGGEGSLGFFSTPEGQPILDAYCHILWSFDVMEIHFNPSYRAMHDDMAFLALQRAAELAKRVYGETSIPYAELVLQLARRAVVVGRAIAAARIAEGALLPALRAAGRAGAGAPPPPTLAQRRGNAFFAAWDVSWRSWAARAALVPACWGFVPQLQLSPVCAEDAVALLARAAVQAESATFARAPGEAARAAAQAHLALLERAFGQGAPDTAAGLESMRDAALVAKDAEGAEGWARRAADARRSAPEWTVELAEAIEALAAIYAAEGPRANKEAARLLRVQALDVRFALGAAGVSSGHKPRTFPPPPARAAGAPGAAVEAPAAAAAGAPTGNEPRPFPPPHATSGATVEAPAAAAAAAPGESGAQAAPTSIAELLDGTITARVVGGRDGTNRALNSALSLEADADRQKRLAGARKEKDAAVELLKMLLG
jgi:hypothetical protein